MEGWDLPKIDLSGNDMTIRWEEEGDYKNTTSAVIDKERRFLEF